MARFNPIYVISVPVLFSLTLPFAFFASLTTIFALVILLFRLLIIYTEIAFEIIPQYLFGKSGRQQPIALPTFFQDDHAAAPKPTINVANLAFASPFLTIPPISGQSHHVKRNRKSSLPNMNRIDTRATFKNPAFGFPLSSAPLGERDFEGLGGWRLDAAPEDTENLLSINSRLELPGTTNVRGIPSPDLSRPRNHHRSATGPLSPALEPPSSNSVLGGRKRHSSVSFNFKTSTSGSLGTSPSIPRINHFGETMRRNSSNVEHPSLNTSRIRSLSGMLSVTPLTSPESERRNPRKTRMRSSSDEYFPRVDGMGNHGSSGDLMMMGRKRLSVGSTGSGKSDDLAAKRLSVSSADSKASGGGSEILNMKRK